MKKMAFVVLGVTLVLIVAWSSDGLCQCPTPDNSFLKPFVIIQNVKHGPMLGNGTFFVVDVQSQNLFPAINRLVEISAQNPENTDEGTYEFDLTPNLRNVFGEWLSPRNFTGQKGTYEVTIKRYVGEPPVYQPLTCQTDEIPENLTPLPVPEKLKVSFENGPTKPTLSFDPVGWVPLGEGEYYQIRIYDRDFTRRIYNVTICEDMDTSRCSKQGTDPTVTFPEKRIGPQTYEDLVPGEEYLFRADLMKEIPAAPGFRRNVLIGTNYKLFKVPKK